MFRDIIKHALTVAVFAASAPFAFSQSESNGEMFDPAAAAKGITYSRQECAVLEKQNTAVWVDVDAGSYCLRYYAAGLRDNNNPVAALWLHGDIMGVHESPAKKRLAGLGVDAMIEQEKNLSARYGIPFIFMGRPGSYASAGRHFTMRERKIEASIVSAGVDALKKKYGIKRWALGGHSGGGILVAEMLNHRNDIQCAVLSSASGAVRDWLAFYNSPDTHNPIVLDPIASIEAIPQKDRVRVFDVFDPRDDNVKFVLHKTYSDALKRHGVHTQFLPLEKALAPEYHDMVDFGETATGMCAVGKSDDDIINRLNEMPPQQKRKTN